MNPQQRPSNPADSVAGTRRPAATDVHVRIWLNGVAFDYRAAAAAIHNVIRDWQRKRWCAIEIVENTVADMLPETRLPNERLFIGR